MTSNIIVFDGLNIKNGGGIIVASRLVGSFLKNGWQVHFLTASEETIKILRDDHNNTNLTIHNKPSLRSTAKALIYRVFQIKSFIELIDPRIVFSFNYWTPSSRFQVTYHINVIPVSPLQECIRSVGLLRGSAQVFYSRLASNRSHLNLFESHHILNLSKNTLGKLPQNSDVKYIGVDSETSITPNTTIPRNLITITSGAKHKRNDLLIQLHKTLINTSVEYHDIGLVIGGFGKEEAIRASLSPEDNEYIDSNPNIRFLGYCTRKELYQEMANALVLVSFSELESFFMVPVEAMSVGCPTITTNVSSIMESVGSAGIVIDKGDVERAKKEVINLLDPRVREEKSTQSRKWAHAFEADKCSQKIVETVTQAYKNSNFS